MENFRQVYSVDKEPTPHCYICGEEVGFDIRPHLKKYHSLEYTSYLENEISKQDNRLREHGDILMAYVDILSELDELDQNIRCSKEKILKNMGRK